MGLFGRLFGQKSLPVQPDLPAGQDAVMYVVLSEEKAIRSQEISDDDFYGSYGSCFSEMDEDEIAQLRCKVLSQMNVPEMCRKYEEVFKGLDFQTKYEASAKAAFFNSSPTDIEHCKAAALEGSRKWFSADEYCQIETLLEDDVNEFKQSLLMNLADGDPKWEKFSSAKRYLHVFLDDYEFAPEPNWDESEFCRIYDKEVLVSVRLTLSGHSVREHDCPNIAVNNLFPWLWQVTIEEIWESAAQNAFADHRIITGDGQSIVEEVASEICEKTIVRKKNARKKNTETNVPAESAPADTSTSDAECDPPEMEVPAEPSAKKKATKTKANPEPDDVLSVIPRFEGAEREERCEYLSAEYADGRTPVLINYDLVVFIPDGMFYSTDEECNGGRLLSAISMPSSGMGNASLYFPFDAKVNLTIKNVNEREFPVEMNDSDQKESDYDFMMNQLVYIVGDSTTVQEVGDSESVNAWFFSTHGHNKSSYMFCAFTSEYLYIGQVFVNGVKKESTRVAIVHALLDDLCVWLND